MSNTIEPDYREHKHWPLTRMYRRRTLRSLLTDWKTLPLHFRRWRLYMKLEKEEKHV